MKLLAALLSVFGISFAQANGTTSAHEGISVKTGDVLVQISESGWSAVKVLEVDLWPDGTAAAHCLTYQPLKNKPSIKSLERASILVMHATIDAGSFGSGWERIGNKVPSEEELVGFIDYLKLTDFQRYVAHTGQDAKDIVRRANEHYKRAFSLTSQGKRVEALSEYDQAIDLFPLFYEAIDNRAFTYMELGKLREALADFDHSLRINPNGMVAFFTKGECLTKLGELKAAENVFSEGLERFPEQQEVFSKPLEQVRALLKNS